MKKLQTRQGPNYVGRSRKINVSLSLSPGLDTELCKCLLSTRTSTICRFHSICETRRFYNNTDLQSLGAEMAFQDGAHMQVFKRVFSFRITRRFLMPRLHLKRHVCKETWNNVFVFLKPISGLTVPVAPRYAAPRHADRHNLTVLTEYYSFIRSFTVTSLTWYTDGRNSETR